MLKVLHVAFTFAPDPVGGTEIYVEALAQELRAIGIEALIAAPSAKAMDEMYFHNGLQVYRYRSAPDSKNMLRELYGLGDPDASTAFARILDQEQPNIVHVHAFTRAVSVLLVRAAKQRRIPVFFTYHTPTVSCQRGTLMLWGRVACDGALIVKRCTSCSLQARGIPRWASIAFTQIASISAKILEKTNLTGGIWTALRMPELIKARREAFRALMHEVDVVVALREWVRKVLLQNQVPGSKIVLCEHGMTRVSQNSELLIEVTSKPLRIAFLGRADKVKGVDTLIKAVRELPGRAVELHLYGVMQSATDRAYWTDLESLVAGDARIKFLPPVPQTEVVSLLRSYHLLAVPSRWLETGPLVILESFSAGTPVIGSNLGGIAEWIIPGKNGLLVDFDDVAGWADTLKRCSENRHLLATLREGVEQPRRMREVAQEMSEMYHRYSTSDAYRHRSGQPAERSNA